MLASILDSATDPNHKYTQYILIANMYFASEIRQQVEIERHCHSADVQNQYKGALFEHNIAHIDAIICQNHHYSTQEQSKQLAINTIGRLDHQSHTSRLNQYTSRLETLERQVRTLTTAFYDNNVGGHSVRAATVKNNNDNRLLELEAMVFKLNNTVTSLYENKYDDDTTTTNSIIRQQQQQQQLSPSHPSMWHRGYLVSQ